MENRSDFVEERQPDLEYMTFLERDGWRYIEGENTYEFVDRRGVSPADGNRVHKSINGNNNSHGGGHSSDRVVFDMQYGQFLENLSEDGRSYILEVKVDEDLSHLYKYETETCTKSSAKAKECLKKRAKREILEARTIPGINLGCETSKSPRNRRMPRKENEVVEDPENVSVRREKRLDSSRVREEVHHSPEKKKKMVEDPKKADLEVGRSSGTNLGSETSSKITRHGKNACLGKANETVPKNVSVGKKRRLNSPPKVRDLPREREKDFVEWDEKYEHFLNNLRNEGGVLVYKQVRYGDQEEEESSSSDVMILSPEEVQVFVTSKPIFIDLDGDYTAAADGDCVFRKELVERLKMPFDAMEYESFFQEVNCRRPKELERRLRGGRDISYVTDDCCQSYLDSHPDLAEKMDSVEGDQSRILNLLRGFFFWLSCVASVGSFKPWMDPSCLKMLPEVKANASLKHERH